MSCAAAVSRGEILSRSAELTKGGADSLGILLGMGTSADTLPRRAHAGTHAATEEGPREDQQGTALFEQLGSTLAPCHGNEQTLLPTIALA
jgi:hypothetical protein